MQYQIVTKNENGVLKIDGRPNLKDMRRTIYFVKDEKGIIKEVDKKWLISNINNIMNLGLSGNSLYLKSKGTQLEKEPLKSLISEIYALIDSKLPLIFKENGVSDIVIETFDSDKIDSPGIRKYKLSVKNDPYRFETGYLVLLCNIGYKNNNIVLSMSLVNERAKYKPYANGGGRTIFEIVEVLLKNKDFILKTVLKMINPEDYNIPCHSNSGTYSSNIFNRYKKDFETKYDGSVYALKYDDIHYHFIDASDGIICVKNAVKVMNKYINENIDTLQSYLYASKSKGSIPYEVVEKTGHYVFPHADLSVKKAAELERKGYKIVVNGTKMTAQEFKSRRDNDLKTHNTWGTSNVKFYNMVKEYVDKKNKVFYCKLGDVCTEDLWC